MPTSHPDIREIDFAPHELAAIDDIPPESADEHKCRTGILEVKAPAPLEDIEEYLQQQLSGELQPYMSGMRVEIRRIA